MKLSEAASGTQRSFAFWVRWSQIKFRVSITCDLEGWVASVVKKQDEGEENFLVGLR